MVASSTESERGDPAVAAMRVERIAYVSQVRGTFQLDAECMESEGAAIIPLNGLGSAEATQEGNRLGVILEYTFRAVAGDSETPDATAVEREPFFEASATFMVEYELDSEETVGEADLRAFAEINGRLNTIPYWREFLHNALTRAGLPAYEVPPFNPVKIARALDIDADEAGD